MSLKKIIPIVVTVIAMVIFSVVLGVSYLKSTIPNGIVEVETPLALASGTISVSPNPCIASQYTDLCTTIISYNTSGSAQLWVKLDDNREALVDCLPDTSGTIESAWLRFGQNYEFRLYPASKFLNSGCVYLQYSDARLRGEPPLDSKIITVNPAPRSITITLSEITNIVNNLKNLTPEQKVGYLSVFYDILKVWNNSGNKGLVDGGIFWKSIEGVKLIFGDSLISSQLLEDAHIRYFNNNPANFTADLSGSLANWILWNDNRPERFDRIMTSSLFKGIVEPLLLRTGSNLSASDVIRNRDINESFNSAIGFIGLAIRQKNAAKSESGDRVTKLTYDDRYNLLNLFTNLVVQIPWMNNWGAFKNFPLDLETNHRVLAVEQTLMTIVNMFELSQFFNYHQISDAQRQEIKNKIKAAFGFSGLDAKTWDEFTFVNSPGPRDDGIPRDNMSQFYYNVFAAYPDIELLQSHTRMVYHQGLNGFRELWDPPSGLLHHSFHTQGGIAEGGLHGIGHNIIWYLIKFNRWTPFGEFVHSGGCKFGETLHYYDHSVRPEDLIEPCMFAMGGEQPPGCSQNPGSCEKTGWSPPETLASNVDLYMFNSRNLFNVALELFDKGYRTPLKQFLFNVNLFSVNSKLAGLPYYESNVSRFYEIPPDFYIDYAPDKVNFTITNIPITRDETLPNDALVRINSLVVDGKEYNFSWSNDAKYILSYTVETIAVPSASLSASPNPCSIPSNQTTCSSTISWQSTNAPNACVFIKETKQLFACAASGNQTASGITEQGSTFEVHLNNDITSQLLASVLVKGIKQGVVQYTLNVSKSGTGKGTITAAGINCGSDCQETYDQGTQVTLTATPDSGSIFKNWSGDCSGTSPTCALTMNSNKSVTAVFEIKVIPPTSVCSTGSVQACIDSIIPSPVKQGQTITFTGSGKTNDSSKTIAKYRWRLDSGAGRTRLCKAEESVVCQVDTTAISPGVHTVYFRVGASRFGKTFTRWSNWIGREFLVK